ncbi:3-oxoacyl-ACP synthase III family protein [Gemmatimonadota bacterium]
MRLARIAGTGHFLPENVVTNKDLEQLMDTTDEWIQERTGIIERRFVEPGTGSSDLGFEAAKAALDEAGWSPEDVDFIIFATLSPDMYFPGDGCLVQNLLGIEGIGALDVRNQCTGFVYSLSIADAYIRMGMYDRILIVGAEVHSTAMSMTTEGRDTAVLFGDGAGAACVEVTDGADGSSILCHRLHANGAYAGDLCMPGPTPLRKPWISKEMIDEGMFTPRMNGREVFRNAVTKFPEVIMEVLEAEDFKVDDLKLVIPHQANERITEGVRKRVGGPPERVFSNIRKYGNTTAASIPIALSEVVKSGLIERGDLICTVAFGSGFTWGANLFRY